MADVTGPISSLPGRSHDVPEGMTCDQHPDRPAIARIQGETDSFGCEMIDMCEECAEEHRAYLRSDDAKEDRKGACEWCSNYAEDLRPARDYEEGLCGRVYQVCGPCIKRVNDEAQAELDAYDYDDGPYYEDDDRCGKCFGEGETDFWDGGKETLVFCTCADGLRLKGQAEARYRAKSAQSSITATGGET